VNCFRCDTPLGPHDAFCPECGSRPDDQAPPLDLGDAYEARPAALAAATIAVMEPPAEANTTPVAPPTFPGIEVYRQRLRDLFGYPDFRSGQAEVLTRLSDGDVLGVMPTGAGKSLCYVLPGLEVGRTLVVSPLIALMQDQVESLQAIGVAATFINSTLSREEQNRRYRDFIEGRTALLYVAPERFANARFVAGLRAAGVNLLVIDEAHCISEWGHDFRPDYLVLGSVRGRLGSPRTLALTATADPVVRRDILVRLGVVGRAAEVVTSFDRPNLRFEVVAVPGESERIDWIIRYARDRKGQAGIVYARTRRNVEQTAAALAAAGVRAVGYHAGMAAADRAHAQRRFITGQVPVLVATNAFGMGIDKPDVRYVIHTHMPGRLEAYYQEGGRAGRDGEPATCTLLYARRDASLQRRFIDQAHPDAEALRRIWQRLVEAQRFAGSRPLLPGDLDGVEQDGLATALGALRAAGLIEAEALRLRSLDLDAPLDAGPIEERRRYAESRLAQMIEYAETPGCRRALILRYFGEQPPERCGNCDNCSGTATASAAAYPEDLFNALLDLRTTLADQSGRPPYMVFEERTAREVATYRPTSEDELLATWGMGQTRMRWFGDRVLGLVREWVHEHPDAEPAPDRPYDRQRVAARVEDGVEVSFDDPLYQRLRAWRRDRARVDGVPAYTLFTDRTARELAALRPTSEADLRSVWGLGDSRVRAFGADLLEVIHAVE
jgi:ATP-dependent DNA helicase RecQ